MLSMAMSAEIGVSPMFVKKPRQLDSVTNSLFPPPKKVWRIWQEDTCGFLMHLHGCTHPFTHVFTHVHALIIRRFIKSRTLRDWFLIPSLVFGGVICLFSIPCISPEVVQDHWDFFL